MGVDTRLGAEHALEQLLVRHLEREHGHRTPVSHGGVRGDIERQGGLPHRGARGQNDEIGRLEAGSQLVELEEPRVDAGDRLPLLGEVFDPFDAERADLSQGKEAGAQPFLGDVEDRFFGFIEHLVGGTFGPHRRGENLLGRADQLAEDRLFLDDLRVVLDVCGARGAVDQRGEVGDPSARVKRPHALQGIAERDEVERGPHLRQLFERLEDPSMTLRVKSLVGEELLRLVDLPVVEENRPQNGSFRLVGVREGFRKNVLQHDRP